MPSGGSSPYAKPAQAISKAELHRARGDRCRAKHRTRGVGRVKCCRQDDHPGAHYDGDRDAWWGPTPAGSVRIFPRGSP